MNWTQDDHIVMLRCNRIATYGLGTVSIITFILHKKLPALAPATPPVPIGISFGCVAGTLIMWAVFAFHRRWVEETFSPDRIE